MFACDKQQQRRGGGVAGQLGQATWRSDLKEVRGLATPVEGTEARGLRSGDGAATPTLGGAWPLGP